MPQLQLRAFNGFSVWRNGKQIHSFRSIKERALIAYLAIETRKIHSRVSLAGLLWPDEDEYRARRNLSQTLLNLRKALGDYEDNRFLDLSSKNITFKHSETVFSDVGQFQAFLNDAQNHKHTDLKTCKTCTLALEKAADLYTGSFLDGFYVPESDLFENWVISTREKLEREAIEVFVLLSQSYEVQNDLSKAQKIIRRILELSPWQEQAQRQLMRLLALSGKRTQALAQFEAYKQVLHGELGVDPAPETIELYEQIVAGALKVKTKTAPQAKDQPQESLAPPFQTAPPPPHFVGRESERTQLRKGLTQTGTPCFALVGMGGVGKSSLATQVAHDLRTEFAGGILWANTATSDPMDILEAWAKAFGYDFSGLADIESRAAAVRGIVAEKKVLVILDNVDQASRARHLMANGDSSPVLITTRDLDVANALNATPLQLGELPSQDSRQLLINILGETRVTKEETAANEICKRLHYLPLAVEIAAQRLKSRNRMPLSSMAERLKTTQNRLSLEISDLAVRTSFEVSWDALNAEQKQFFPLLAVFEGRPFTPAALAHIANIDVYTAEDNLYTLAALSLIGEEGSAHYKQHPLLADFAKEKLVDETFRQHSLLAEFTLAKLGNPEVAYARMADYYFEFSKENGKNYDALNPDWGNMIASIEVAHKQENWQLVIGFTDALAETWMTRGRYSEARAAYRLAQDASEKLNNAEVIGNNYLRWSEVCIAQNDYQEAIKHLKKCLNNVHNPLLTGEANYHLADIAIDQGRVKDAEVHLENSQATFEVYKKNAELAKVDYQRARIYHESGNFDKARTHAEKALKKLTQTDDSTYLARVLLKLSSIAIMQHDLEAALDFNKRALEAANKAKDEGQLVSVMFNFTAINRRLGNIEEAQSNGERALKLAKRSGRKRTEAMLCHELSFINKELKNHKYALDLDLSASEIYRQIEDSIGLALALLNIGDLYQILNESDKSLQSWLEVRDISRSLNDAWFLEELAKRGVDA